MSNRNRVEAVVKWTVLIALLAGCAAVEAGEGKEGPEMIETFSQKDSPIHNGPYHWLRVVAQDPGTSPTISFDDGRAHPVFGYDTYVSQKGFDRIVLKGTITVQVGKGAANFPGGSSAGDSVRLAPSPVATFELTSDPSAMAGVAGFVLPKGLVWRLRKLVVVNPGHATAQGLATMAFNAGLSPTDTGVLVGPFRRDNRDAVSALTNASAFSDVEASGGTVGFMVPATSDVYAAPAVVYESTDAAGDKPITIAQGARLGPGNVNICGGVSFSFAGPAGWTGAKVLLIWTEE